MLVLVVGRAGVGKLVLNDSGDILLLVREVIAEEPSVIVFKLSDVGFEVIVVIEVLVAVVSVELKADVCVIVDWTVVEADIVVGTEEIDDVDNIVDIDDVDDGVELRVVGEVTVVLGLFVLK